MTATYTFRDAGGDVVRSSPFGKPTPAHALTPAAEQAREAVRRFAYDRNLRREIAELVTDHGAPHVEPYAGARPAAATSLAARAERAGFRVNVFETTGRVRTVVEGFKDPHAFRVSWHRGRAESGSWHGRHWRYGMREDSRPVGVAATSKTGLAGKRAAGVGAIHLTILASPLGVPCGVAEISKRVSEA